MKVFVICFFVLSLFGCVVKMINPVQKLELEKNYKIGIKQTVKVGEKIIFISNTKKVPRYIATKTFEAPYPYGENIEIKKGAEFFVIKYTKKGDILITNNEYSPNLAIRISPKGRVVTKTKVKGPSGKITKKYKNNGRGWMSPAVVLAKGTTSNVGYIKISGQKQWPIGRLFKKSKKGHPVKGFTAELVYSGKSGSDVKILYREFINDFARNSFYQNLTYNLKESKEISYKSLKIEILEATNSSISYIVKEDEGLKWVPAP